MATDSKQRFVFGGRRRIATAAQMDIRQEVEREYADRLDSAGPIKRLILFFKMRREIRRRVNRVAPRDGLYMSA